jgi:low affinity Fe/Cu permease
MKITVTIEQADNSKIKDMIQAIRDSTGQEVNARVVSTPTLPFSTKL